MCIEVRGANRPELSIPLFLPIVPVFFRAALQVPPLGTICPFLIVVYRCPLSVRDGVSDIWENFECTNGKLPFEYTFLPFQILCFPDLSSRGAAWRCQKAKKELFSTRNRLHRTPCPLHEARQQITHRLCSQFKNSPRIAFRFRLLAI